jgi:GT2 family glycosyltransferase
MLTIKKVKMNQTTRQAERRPSVAVVIPTWNRGALLIRSVTSVLEQGSVVQKVFVVDNGTQPANLKVISDERVVLIRTEPSIGASAARNIGAESASTELVAFLDDDDYWEPGFLDSALPLFEQSADIVVGQLQRKADVDSKSVKYKLMDDSESGLRKLYFSNPGFGGQNIIVRLKLFNELGGFDVSMPASNDRDLAVRALQAGATIRVQPASVAVLCDHSGARVRHNQVRGNYCFLKKHWWAMRWSERRIASTKLLKRFLKAQLGR